jgi:putative nucleotidyltransferase with HDIG domain
VRIGQFESLIGFAFWFEVSAPRSEMRFLRKTSPRRNQVRKSILAERSSETSWLADADVITSALVWLLFVAVWVSILSLDLLKKGDYRSLIPLAAIVVLISAGAGVYIYHYQKRIIRNHARALALGGLFSLLLAAAKLGVLSTGHTAWATGTAVTVAIILAIAYDQRFAMGMSLFYCLLACLAAQPTRSAAGPTGGYEQGNMGLLFTMIAGTMVCCFRLREIRTRMKLLEVGILAALTVFIAASALGFLAGRPQPADSSIDKSWVAQVFSNAGYHAGTALLVGLLIQSLLPVIEKVFRIATSMTLLDYSDASQPLLKRLAMEAPGTFSHSLLIGSIAEAAAEAIGRNGLLCRVGAYYHDIGKINKPDYFAENEMGSTSRHKELSPAMSQLIIVGHVKDGIEIAKEYGLPIVLRQFIETHHVTTLVEPFYNEAKKKHNVSNSKDSSGRKRKEAPPSESEFRYAGPKPRTKEGAIVMLADAVESAARSLAEATPTKIEAVVRNMAMRRLQDGQFDECDLSLRELHQIEASMSKTLAGHYHGRVVYPKAPDEPESAQSEHKQAQQKKN